MYARLKDNYFLRGWQGLPFAVVSRKSGAAVFTDAETFSLFKFLDGQHDLDFLPLTFIQNAALQNPRLRKAVDFSEEPFPENLPPPLAAYKVYPCRALTSIHWSITGACNLRCRHCYISAPSRRCHDLDTETCLSFVDLMAEAGVAAVSLSGGEPLTRPDFWVILDKLLTKNITVASIFTNGLLVDEKFLDEAGKRGLTCDFLVSFDGTGCHDALRGMAGCEARTLAAIERIVARGYRVLVNTVLYEGNMGSLLPTYQALVSAGVDTWRLSPIALTGEWLSAAPAPLPREALFAAYLDIASRIVADNQPMAAQMASFFACERGKTGARRIPAVKLPGTEAGLGAFSCRICRVHPNLLPDGRLIPCAMLADVEDFTKNMPNLLKTPLIEVFSPAQNAENPFFSLSCLKCADIIAENPQCRECAHRFECGGGCRAQSALEGRGFRGYDADVCAFFKDGWREKFAALL